MLSENILHEELYMALEQLGLTPHECRLYIISLKLGPSSIPELADKLGISRPNLYKVIKGLAEKGLAHLPERKRYARTFVVESPTMVMDLVRKKYEEVKKIDTHLTGQLPSLLREYQQGATPSKVKVLSGEKDFLKAYTRVFEEADGSVQFFGELNEFIKMVGPEFGNSRIQRRVQRGVVAQALVLPGYEKTGLRTSMQDKREIRVLKEANPFTTSFYLYANKVILWQPKTPLAILIEDEYFVSMFRSMFLLLWNSSEPVI